MDRVKQLETLIEEMVTSNQEVIDEASNTAEDYKLRVWRNVNFSIQFFLIVKFQVESLEQQLKGEKRFLEEQAREREFEREEFFRRIEYLEEILRKKEKEEDSRISIRDSGVSNGWPKNSVLINTFWYLKI